MPIFHKPQSARKNAITMQLEQGGESSTIVLAGAFPQFELVFVRIGHI